jgi:hypothetical protein
MYYIMIAERTEPAVARNIARAESSSAARRVALAMDIAMHGRPSGRLFYLDQESFIDWCTRGKAVGALPGADAGAPSPALVGAPAEESGPADNAVVKSAA